MYRVSFYPQCTTAGGADRTLDVSIYWTDLVGATNQQVVTAFSLAATGRLNILTNRDDITFFATAGAIQYSTTVNGVLGSPRYALDIRVEWLG